jgi:short subunit dehydrogenase-like uncharacterized protein
MERTLPSISTGATFATLALVVPVWAVTVLPLTVLYQVGKKTALSLTLTLTKSKDKSKSKDSNEKHPDHLPPLDSGYVVDPALVVDRPDRQYDVVVLGATGFVGGLCVRYLAETYGLDGAPNTAAAAAASQQKKKKKAGGGTKGGVKWAIAGRSAAKLDAVKQQLAVDLNLSLEHVRASIDSIVVDVTVPATLPALVSQTRAVATTAGPYTFYGNAVVEFCAKFGTHYVDITGEVDWVRAMLAQWQDTAVRSGAKLVPFCGHDSIPWDLSVMKLQELLRQQCDDDLETVTFWDEAVAAPPGGTLATLMANIEGKSIRAPRADFDPFLRLPDGSKSQYVAKTNLPWTVNKCESPWDTDTSNGDGSNDDDDTSHQNQNNKKKKSTRYTMPFVMAGVNAGVVKWSHALRQQGSKELTYREMSVCPDWKTAVTQYTGFIMFGSLLLNPITGYLMKQYVLPKPGEGPSRDSMLRKHFLCVSGVGVGRSGNVAESILYFPTDPGCLETAGMLIESALCLAQQDEDLPVSTGGFWTPAVGLGQVLLDRLMAMGTHFESHISTATPKEQQQQQQQQPVLPSKL